MPEVVVPASTPVVSFGDPLGAVVATLGINPSTRQFLRQSGALRVGAERRLATLPWLGLSDWEEMDGVAGARVLSECAAYFGPAGVPYRRWFDPFDRLLRAGLGVSYYDGTACHLNLVPWATDPVWRGLDRDAWRRLLDAELPYLVEHLGDVAYRIVVVNGRTVMSEVAAAGLVEWTVDRRLDGPPAADLCIGERRGTRWVGWTCNLQNQPGAARLAGDLGGWLPSVAASSSSHQPRRSTGTVSTTSSPSRMWRRS